MAKNLTPKGVRAAKAAAKAFLEDYADAIESAALEVVKGIPKAERAALKFFQGKSRTSAYACTTFPDVKRGCKTATVRLHPHPSWKDAELGGSTTIKLPAALDPVRKIFPGERFISGHMINADFGGNETLPGNQTVLTAAANSQHHFDESMKAACMAMGQACYEMARYSHAEDADTYLAGLYRDWRVKIDVTVGDESWYDIYKDDEDLEDHANVKNPYPTNAVATQIVFKATVQNTPTAEDIAENLLIEESKMRSIAESLTQFQQFINDSATFELNQPAPADFKRARSLVTTTTIDNLNVSTTKESAGAKKPYPKKK